MQDVYDVEFVKKVYDSPIVSYEELKTGKISFDGDVRIQYHTKDIYKRTAKMLGLMDDFRVNNLVLPYHNHFFPCHCDV